MKYVELLLVADKAEVRQGHDWSFVDKTPVFKCMGVFTGEHMSCRCFGSSVGQQSICNFPFFFLKCA